MTVCAGVSGISYPLFLTERTPGGRELLDATAAQCHTDKSWPSGANFATP